MPAPAHAALWRRSFLGSVGERWTAADDADELLDLPLAQIDDVAVDFVRGAAAGHQLHQRAPALGDRRGEPVPGGTRARQALLRCTRARGARPRVFRWSPRSCIFSAAFCSTACGEAPVRAVRSASSVAARRAQARSRDPVNPRDGGAHPRSWAYFSPLLELQKLVGDAAGIDLVGAATAPLA